MNFVRDQSASQRLSDDIDVADLINAILDVTGYKQQLNETGPSNRYSTNENAR